MCGKSIRKCRGRVAILVIASTSSPNESHCQGKFSESLFSIKLTTILFSPASKEKESSWKRQITCDARWRDMIGIRISECELKHTLDG